MQRRKMAKIIQRNSYRKYAPKDLLLLAGNAAGQCSFEACLNEIILHPSNVFLGHIAHIVAFKPDGPRGDKNFSMEKLNKYENLILERYRVSKGHFFTIL